MKGYCGVSCTVCRTQINGLIWPVGGKHMLSDINDGLNIADLNTRINVLVALDDIINGLKL
jgi:hypothetical protein